MYHYVKCFINGCIDIIQGKKNINSKTDKLYNAFLEILLNQNLKRVEHRAVYTKWPPQKSEGG